jgi:hypothetical protein
MLPIRAKRMSMVEVESAVLGNSDAAFGGGVTFLPTGQAAPYPTGAKKSSVGFGMRLITAVATSWPMCLVVAKTRSS